RQRALNELERVLAGSLGLEDVLPRLLEGLLGLYPNAERGFMLLYDARSRRLVLRAKHFRGGPSDETVRLSLSLLERVMESRQGVLSENVAEDSQIGATTSFTDARIRSLMCVPIIDDAGDLLGILQVDTSDARRGFRAADLELLVGLAGRASQAVQQAIRYQAAIGQEQLRRDLSLAHQVQQGLLPVKPPDLGGYEFFDHYEAASEIGGDFFTYVPIGEGRLAVVLADVSGKGISAALVMAALSADVRYCLAMESDPAEAVRRINGSFQKSSWEERFATLVVAVLDPPREKLVIVNAGHPPVMLRTAAGEVKLLDAGRPGLPIGMVDDFIYARVEYSLAPGDVIVLYTDGVSEAMDQRQEPYGLERLQLAIESAGGVGPEAVGRSILRDVERHAAGQIRSDDICLVCVGRR
ncbi:MAG: GAF domain-containing protein, partial [Planctomycetia bacterium]|nr:GAF domain-containing protein [Planctomycetia bacterium]